MALDRSRGANQRDRRKGVFHLAGGPFWDIRTRAVDGTELLTEGSFTEHHVQVWSPLLLET